MCLTESDECKRIVRKLQQIDGVILVRFYKLPCEDSITGPGARVCGPDTFFFLLFFFNIYKV